ncbi:MAG: hypothetical protein GY756_15425 [bacterium]|nr:hypothetical protein [bacterium]
MDCANGNTPKYCKCNNGSVAAGYAKDCNTGFNNASELCKSGLNANRDECADGGTTTTKTN